MSMLHDLADVGQSVWLDYIRRQILDNGELDSMISDGLRGLTSNPTIFHQAIAGSDDYDSAISAYLIEHPEASVEEVYEHLAVADIQRAADAFAGVYEETDGLDGYVSLEVSPHLAHDTETTISEAKRLWGVVDRPNLMVKVPATPAGIPAIAELVGSGININATLMFSMDHYEAVAQAYLDGLTNVAEPHRVASVASFFVSRVDSKIDALLEKIGTDEAMALRGTVAVANSRSVYHRYQQIFEGDDFARLRTDGARPQRVLWASTSTKNPEYDDLLYVEPLIGSETVNTLPPATLEALVDHGTVTAGAVLDDPDGVFETLDMLVDVGVDLDQATEELQVEGVQKFAASFDELMSALAAEIERLR
ncbi:MAG: transaldolase [Acidimicrobiia bacterium]|nr:transaldolase [Acidimicrobiia bacterium]